MNTSFVAKYWDKRGGTYDRSWQSFAKKKLSQLETDILEKAIDDIEYSKSKKSIKVLDIGIAIGRICDSILKHNVQLYGTDVSQTMVDYCRKKYKNNKKVKELRLHDIHRPLPKSWGKFDVVSAYRVLAYTPHLKKELTIIYNSMNKGGRLIFTYPNKYSSALIPKLIYSKDRMGNEMTEGEIRKIASRVGFSSCQIGGFSRLLDTFYDLADNKITTNLLYGVENILQIILGRTLFVRLFYVTCVK